MMKENFQEVGSSVGFYSPPSIHRCLEGWPSGPGWSGVGFYSPPLEGWPSGPGWSGFIPLRASTDAWRGIKLTFALLRGFFGEHPGLYPSRLPRGRGDQPPFNEPIYFKWGMARGVGPDLSGKVTGGIKVVPHTGARAIGGKTGLPVLARNSYQWASRRSPLRRTPSQSLPCQE